MQHVTTDRSGSRFLTPVNVVYSIVLLALTAYSIGFLNRFPGQDLPLNDLMLLNNVRWASQNIAENGLFAWLTTANDFREALGENLFASVKAPPGYLDLSIYLSLLVGADAAIVIKRLVYAALCIVCCHEIAKRNQAGDRVEFYLFTAAIVLMPNLYHEVGMLNQTPLLMMPALYLSVELMLERLSWLRYLLFAVALILMAGASDLFFFFNIVSVFALCLFLNPSRWRAVFIFGFIATAFGAFHFGNVFLERLFPSGSYVGHAGSWDFRNFIDAFWQYLFKGLIAPYFRGPVCLFTTLFVFPYALAAIVTGNRKALWGLAAVLGVFALQSAMSFVLHGIPALSARLPSAVRYNFSGVGVVLCVVLLSNPLDLRMRTLVATIAGFAIWFLLAMLTFGVGDTLIGLYYEHFLSGTWPSARTIKHLVLAGIGGLSFAVWYAGMLQRRGVWSAAARIAAFVAVPLLVFASNLGFRYAIVGQGSAHFGDAEMSRWINGGVQSCILGAIARSPYPDHPRSFVFVAPRFAPDSPIGRHDLLMSIVEQPEKLGGRTFGHWRYGHAPLTSALYRKYVDAARFAWPPIFEFPDRVAGLAAATYSPFVIAAGDSSLPKDFESIGVCRLPAGVVPLTLTINPTFNADIHVYYYRGYATRFSEIASASFHSSYASFMLRQGVDARLQPMISLPISYHPGQLVMIDGERRPIMAGPEGYAAVEGVKPGSQIVVTSRRITAPISILAALLLGALWPVLALNPRCLDAGARPNGCAV